MYLLAYENCRVPASGSFICRSVFLKPAINLIAIEYYLLVAHASWHDYVSQAVDHYGVFKWFAVWYCDAVDE